MAYVARHTVFIATAVVYMHARDECTFVICRPGAHGLDHTLLCPELLLGLLLEVRNVNVIDFRGHDEIVLRETADGVRTEDDTYLVPRFEVEVRVVSLCVCMHSVRFGSRHRIRYIYIYMCVCVCVLICQCMCASRTFLVFHQVRTSF